MTSANKYARLFEPVKIGPVTARNRFYQVPHCNGMGHLRPKGEAAMRGVKAEGGWAVVSNQETEIHPTSDLSPYAEGRLWDERDIPALRLMTEAVHAYGSLAAVELVHNGNHALNLVTRAPLLAPSDMSMDHVQPRQARAMDKTDIRNFRRWHREAAVRARDAGFDIVYVYAGHHMTLTQHFLLPQMNDRTDEYGGSLENRVRLMREILEETHDAVGQTCAVAMRFAVDEMMGEDGMQSAEEGRAVIEMLAELPDLWDVNVSDWSNDSATTRFQPEDGYQTPYISFVKDLTSKPVVAVGRLTSPDLMLSMVEKGIVDFIGAARPSIADPFLPRKIEEGRIEDIRECIGCNICVAADNLGVPIRCTQNPTMGEEWRRGWHPEVIAAKENESSALVVGAGPAGLECAMQLARRGYDVTLAEATETLGGRVTREAALQGLSAWRRVADNRVYELRLSANVSIYIESAMDAAQVAELGIRNVFVATGARWRRDGIGRSSHAALPIDEGATVLTPDDIMSGNLPPDGRVLIYDDDQIYLAGALAHELATKGYDVSFVTPASVVSPWTENTLEQARIQATLLNLGVEIHTDRRLVGTGKTNCEAACVFTNRRDHLDCDATVLVTGRTRQSSLYDHLKTNPFEGLKTLELIGDAASPGLIADAVYSGHMAARNVEASAAEIARQEFARELIDLSS